jgi:hypothetical protein
VVARDVPCRLGSDRGRFKAPHDNGVTVDGSITLDDLRRVFPGF